MRALLFIVILILVGIVCVGFYRSWFHFSTASTDQTTSATISVDQEKIREDEQKAKDKVQEFGQEAKEKTGDQAEKVEEPEFRP